MNKYEQFTVYVAKEPQLATQKKINWTEVRYRFKNSNKRLLAFGFICLLGGPCYLMWSNFTSANNPTLPLQICLWALFSFGALYVSMKNVGPFGEIKGESQKIKSADEIRSAVAQLGIHISTTKDLFRLLELGENNLFEDIREYTLATLQPRRDKDVNQVNRFFDTIQYCVENNQKTGPDDLKFPIIINSRNYPEVSGAYINKLMGRKYKSANIYLDWLSE